MSWYLQLHNRHALISFIYRNALPSELARSADAHALVISAVEALVGQEKGR